MNKEDVGVFETLQAQLRGLYEEMQTLVKKSPNDAVNRFKLSLINSIISRANDFLVKEQRPFDDFVKFPEDNLPSNSDVLVILSQYLSCLEKIRADNIEYEWEKWYWIVDGERSEIRTAPPKKLQK